MSKKLDGSWKEFEDALDSSLKSVKKHLPKWLSVCFLLLMVGNVSAGVYFGLNRIIIKNTFHNEPLYDTNYDQRNPDQDQLFALGEIKSTSNMIIDGYYENVYITDDDNDFYISTKSKYYNITIKCNYYEGNVAKFTSEIINSYEIIDVYGYFSISGYYTGDFSLSILIKDEIPFDLYIETWSYINNGLTYNQSDPFYLDWYVERGIKIFKVSTQLDNQWFAIWKQAGDVITLRYCSDYEVYYHEKLMDSLYCPHTGYYTIKTKVDRSQIYMY